MIIKVCVGSSCHLKGSYDVIEAFKEILKRHNVEDRIELQASFCLGQCAKGVSAQIEELAGATVRESPSVTPIADGFLLHNVNKDNAEDLFVKEVLPLLN